MKFAPEVDKLLCQPWPLGFGREIIPQAVTVERGVGPARYVDELAFAQHRPRIVGDGELREGGEIPGKFGGPATSEGITRPRFRGDMRGRPVITQDIIDDFHVAKSLPRYAAMKTPLHTDPGTAAVRIGVLGRRVSRHNPAMPVRVHARHPLRGWVMLDPDDFMIAGIVVARKSQIVVPEEMVRDDRFIRMKNGHDVFQRKELVRHIVQPWRELHHACALLRARRRRRFGREELLIKGGGIAEVALAVSDLCFRVDRVEASRVGGADPYGKNAEE